MGQVTRPLRQGLAWVATRYGLEHALVDRFVGRFFSEVTTYLDQTRPPTQTLAHDAALGTGPLESHARTAARARVRVAIEDHAPQVVVAHSLGSVIAYEALMEPDMPAVPLLVTLGSPLAMPGVVYDRLRPPLQTECRTRPPAVSKWINIADPGDIIAIPPHLSLQFDGITADLESAIHAFDFHRVRNYLRSSTVAATLAAQLA